MSTLAPAPIRFVTVARAKETGLILPARPFSVAEIVNTLDVRRGGIALFAVEDGNVAIRVGREDTGIVGYARAEHGIAFVSAVVTALTDEARAKGIAKRDAQRIAQERTGGSFTVGRAADGSVVRLGEVKGGGADGDNW